MGRLEAEVTAELARKLTLPETALDIGVADVQTILGRKKNLTEARGRTKVDVGRRPEHEVNLAAVKSQPLSPILFGDKKHRDIPQAPRRPGEVRAS